MPHERSEQRGGGGDSPSSSEEHRPTRTRIQPTRNLLQDVSTHPVLSTVRIRPGSEARRDTCSGGIRCPPPAPREPHDMSACHTIMSACEGRRRGGRRRSEEHRAHACSLAGGGHSATSHENLQLRRFCVAVGGHVALARLMGVG